MLPGSYLDYLTTMSNLPTMLSNKMILSLIQQTQWTDKWIQPVDLVDYTSSSLSLSLTLMLLLLLLLLLICFFPNKLFSLALNFALLFALSKLPYFSSPSFNLQSKFCLQLRSSVSISRSANASAVETPNFFSTNLFIFFCTFFFLLHLMNKC